MHELQDIAKDLNRQLRKATAKFNQAVNEGNAKRANFWRRERLAIMRLMLSEVVVEELTETEHDFSGE